MPPVTKQYIVPVIILLCVLQAGFSQPKQEWYKVNDRGNRFEGIYVQTVRRNPVITWVGLYASFESYERGRNQKLSVHFFSPDTFHCQLKAEELRTLNYYWMEAKFNRAESGWNVFPDWPVDDWLGRLNIGYEKLGVLMKVNDSVDITAFPVYITHSGEMGKLSLYTSYFRLGINTTDVSYIVYRGKPSDMVVAEKNKIMEGRLGRKPRDASFTLIIPANKLGQNEGWYTIRLKMQESGYADPIESDFVFYHTWQTPPGSKD